VDYDSTPIPDVYVQARRLPAEAMDLWRQVVLDMLPPAPSIRRVLDLGCGTGRFTEMLGDSYHATVGIDPSLRMLAQRAPSADSSAHFVAAHAESLPLGAGSMDLVFLSMVYHHLRPRDAVAEIARVLSRNGHVSVRNPTREAVPDFEYMQFFPEALAFDLSRMPPRDGLRDHLRRPWPSGGGTPGGASSFRGLLPGIFRQDLRAGHLFPAGDSRRGLRARTGRLRASLPQCP
jgi:SAM-dependent methyltransferase